MRRPLPVPCSYSHRVQHEPSRAGSDRKAGRGRVRALCCVLRPTLTRICARSGVLAKLLAFSLALAVAPIGSYFLSLNYVWNGTFSFPYSMFRT